MAFVHQTVKPYLIDTFRGRNRPGGSSAASCGMLVDRNFISSAHRRHRL